MTTQEKSKTWKEEEEYDANTTMLMEMCHCVWEKLKEEAKTAAAAIKRTTTKKTKWLAEAKICAAIRQEGEMMKKQ